jgi:hypothetical protein
MTGGCVYRLEFVKNINIKQYLGFVDYGVVLPVLDRRGCRESCFKV